MHVTRRPGVGAGAVRRAHRRAGLLAGVVVAAVLRVAWLLYARPEPVSDFKQYLRLATGLVDTGVFGPGAPSAWRLPAFPVVLAAGAVVDRDPVALGAVTVLLSVLQVALTWWVALRTFRSTVAATVAALTAAVLPAFVAFAPVLASEHLLAVLVLGALGVAIGPGGAVGPGGRRPLDDGAGWRRALAAGTLLGVATLTRGEAAAYLPAVATVVAAGVWRRTRRPSAVVGVVAVAAAGLLLIVGPWVARNERVVGRGAGLTTTGGFNFYLAHSPGGYGWRTPLPPPLRIDDEILRDGLGWRHGLRFVRERPGDLVPTAWHGTIALFGPSTYAARYATVRFDLDLGRVVARDDLRWRDLAIAASGAASPVLLLTALAGLALRARWRRSAWWAVVGVVGANWVLYAVVFWAQPRYRFVVDAVACVAVGAVGAGVERWWSQRQRDVTVARSPTSSSASNAAGVAGAPSTTKSSATAS